MEALAARDHRGRHANREKGATLAMVDTMPDDSGKRGALEEMCQRCQSMLVEQFSEREYGPVSKQIKPLDASIDDSGSLLKNPPNAQDPCQ